MMKGGGKMNLIEKLKNYFISRGSKKNIYDLASIFIIGLIIVMAYSFFTEPGRRSPGYIEVKETNEENTSVNKVVLGYEEQVEQELTDVLSQISGAGKVKVMIHFESGTEVITAYSQNNSNKITEENDGGGGKRITNESTNSNNIVMANEGGNNKPFVLKELKPKISGVIVISEGANNPDVKYKLYEAVKTVFSLPQYKINIYPMEKQN